MKKRLLSILMAIGLMFSNIPTVFAADASGSQSLQDLINQTNSGETIVLTSDYDLTGPVTINKSITIKGGDHTITYSGAKDDDFALLVNAQGVTLENINVNALSGVMIQASGAKLDTCDINVYGRGIYFNFDEANDNATLEVNNCNIVNTKADQTYGVYYDTDNRGIATRNITNGQINVTGGSILGFKYGINPVIPDASGLRNGNGTVFNVTNTTIQGWTALNVWSANTTYNFTNCVLSGINKFEGGFNDFAVINANDGISGGDPDLAPVVNIVGGEMNVVRHGESIQAAVNVDYQCITKVYFLKHKLKNVQINCYGTPNNPAPVFLFDDTVTESQMDNYVTASNYYKNVTGTSHVLGARALQTNGLDDKPFESIQTNQPHIGGGSE